MSIVSVQAVFSNSENKLLNTERNSLKNTCKVVNFFKNCRFLTNFSISFFRATNWLFDIWFNQNREGSQSSVHL